MITPAEIRAKRELSSSVKAIKIQQYIDQAEITLRKWMGEELYQDVKNNPSLTTKGSYPDLLEGSTYVYGSYTYTHPGVKEVLIDLTYADYVFFGSQTDTPFGMVQKQYADGQQISTRARRETYDELRRIAEDKWHLVEDYLARKADEYDLWFLGEARIDDDRSWVNINKGYLK